MNASVSPWLAVASTVLSVLFVPLIAFITARRSRSGRVNTSDAADLWNESRSIRQELRAELGETKKLLEDANRDREALREELHQLREDYEMERLDRRHERDELGALRVEVSQNRERIALLTETLVQHQIPIPVLRS